MKWLNKLLGRKNTVPAAKAPQKNEKISAPQTVFSEEPPLPWDATTREKIRNSDYEQWYLAKVGAIERYTETYRVTFVLTWNGQVQTIELPGSRGYGEVLHKMEIACGIRRDHWYEIVDWPHVQPVWGPDSADGPRCWLCEFEEKDLIFHVADLGEITPGPVLYGCPFASDIPIPDKSRRPVTVIRFGGES